jgi:phytoene desaturase
MASVGIIGAGFAGISAASFLAKEGFDVMVLEKLGEGGGRARKFEANGYTFDMGPSWYWMPDVFERFFQHFGKEVANYYQLKRLDPSYRIFYSKQEVLDVPSGIPALCDLFDRIEPGSGSHLLNFLDEGKYKYEVAMHDLVYKPGISFRELLRFDLLADVFKLHVFRSLSGYVRKFFRDQRLIKLLEFPVLFLGAAPHNTPALYSLMNYADMGLGTWYPVGGMHKIVEAMMDVATSLGVKFMFNSNVEHIQIKDGIAKALVCDGQEIQFDAIVASADYHHVERHLLETPYRNYKESYWRNKTMAPSSLIFYLGLNKTLKNLRHHNLFFDKDFALHATEIYEKPSWPTEPLFYVCCPSKSDDTVAPVGHENLFILVPVASGLSEEEATREKYFEMVICRLESLTGEDIRPFINFKRSYAHSDFERDYNAFKGNAYGLANTLRQTANLKPSIANKKVPNLFYAGQLTVPGPGVPPSLISGQVVAHELTRKFKRTGVNKIT